MTQPVTTTQYEVWYDAVDGARRYMISDDTAGCDQIISDLNDDEARRALLAQQVGISRPAHAYNITQLQVDTTTTTLP